MTDILSRLRGDIPHRLIEDHWTIDFEALDAEREEAATEIERLRTKVYQLENDLALTRAMLPTKYKYEVVMKGIKE